MKFVTNCGLFHKALTVISGLKDKKGEEEYLRQVLICVKEDNVELTSMAAGGSIKHAFDPSPESFLKDNICGEGVVDLGRLKDLLATYEADSSLMLEQINPHQVNIKVGTEGEFTFHSLPSEIFPTFAKVVGKAKFTAETSQLRKSIQLIKQCMAQRDTRAYLNGMHFDFEIDGITLVATDGHSLGVSSVEGANPVENACGVACTVARDHIGVLLNKLKLMEEEVIITTDGAKICFEDTQTLIVFNVIDGAFPNYRGVIPQYKGNRADIQVKKVIALFERIRLMSSEDTHGVEVKLNREIMTVQSRNKIEEKGADSIDIEYEGDPQSFGVNANFIVDHLGSASRQGITEMTLSKGSSFKDSILFEPSNQNCGRFLYVVSPMKID